MLNTLREFFHIAAHLFRRDLGVDLRRADAAVSQHLRERFDGHVVRQAHRRRVGMAAHVPRNVLLDTAFSRNHLDAVLAVGIARNGQQLIAIGHAVVLFDDMLGHLQQAYIRFRTRLLTVGDNPQMAVERGLQVRSGQVRHIRPAQPRKGAEDEQVADHLVTFLFECPVNQQLDFLFGQKAPFRFFFGDAVREKRIALQQSVIDGHVDNLTERHHIRPNRIVAMVLFGFEEKLEVGDERRSKLL